MNFGHAIRLASTREMSREQWLAVRNGGIGASDAAAAIGLSPYKSSLALWLEKTGRRPVEDLSDKEAVFWGTTLEPLLAKVYADRTGNRVRRVNAVLQHPQHRFMLANLDRAVGAEGVLEIKTAGFHAAPLWDESVPEAYQCQVLHQLAVTGKTWADVAVLIAGQDFRIYRFEREEATIAALIERERAFWQQVLGDVRPAVDGSASCGRALAWLYPSDGGTTVDCSESTELNTLFRELLSFKRQREQLEFFEATHRQSIQAAMGTASTALFVGGKVSWKKARDSQGVDVQRLLAEHPELAAQYATTSPGSRRFLMQVDTASPSRPQPSASGAPAATAPAETPMQAHQAAPSPAERMPS